MLKLTFLTKPLFAILKLTFFTRPPINPPTLSQLVFILFFFAEMCSQSIVVSVR
jgi:hypothetical protein